VSALAKPAATAEQTLMVHHEVAGWELAKVLGCNHLMNAAVIRRVVPPNATDDVEVALMSWRASMDAAQVDVDIYPDEEVWLLAVFDFLTRHSDSAGNYATVPSDPTEPHVVAFDFGYCFVSGVEPNSRFEQARRDRPVPEPHRGTRSPHRR
jgi:hypothetical protein